MNKAARISGAICAIFLSFSAQAQDDNDDNYQSIEADLRNGLLLQEVADRAYDNADDYWANNPGQRDGDDDELSAGEAVTAPLVADCRRL